MRDSELTAIYSGPDHCVAMYRNLLLMVAKDDPLPELVELAPRWTKRLQKQAPGKIGFIVVLVPDNPPPKEAARATIKKTFQIFDETMSFGAITVEKTGFMSAAQRSILNMILLAARPKIPIKVFATVEEACRWVTSPAAEESKTGWADVNGALERLRAGYDANQLAVV
jgi:hypothetical protein